MPTEKETSNLLRQVLDNNSVAADLLAKEVHLDTSLSIENQRHLESLPDCEINIEDFGIWIDPIGW